MASRGGIITAVINVQAMHPGILEGEPLNDNAALDCVAGLIALNFWQFLCQFYWSTHVMRNPDPPEGLASRNKSMTPGGQCISGSIIHLIPIYLKR